MPSGFNCLTRFDRCQFQALKKSGFPQRGIAAEIGCRQSADPPATPGCLAEAGIMTVSPTWIHRYVHADRAGGGGACSAASAGGAEAEPPGP